MRIIHIRSGSLGFKARLLVGLAIAITLGMLALLALAVVGILLFILPVLLVAGVMYALLPVRRTAYPPQSSDPADVLEGRYRIIDRAKDRD